MAEAADEDRLAVLEQSVADLARTVEALERRLAGLEKEGARVHRAVAAERRPETAEEALPPGSDVTRLLGLTGRTLIVFGGAYLLRAVTAAGYMPEAAGVLLAFLYALSWLFLADRAGAKGAVASASFHGATAVLIGLPLLWETTARFHYLTPAAGGLAMAVFVAAALGIAWHQRLHALAWVVGLAAPAVALALLATTHVPAPFGFDLVFLGIGGLFLYYSRGWKAVGWWMALTGHLGGLLAAFGALAQRKDEAAALAILLLLCLAYLAAVVWRTLIRGGEAGAFEAAQSCLAALFGYGGSALVARALGAGTAALVSILGLLLAVAAYWTAFRVIPRAERRKLLLYSVLALAFTLAGSGLLLPARPLAIAWALLAALTGWLSLRLARVTLALHGTFYALAAAAASGLLMMGLYALATPATVAWPRLTAQAFLALLAAAAVCALPVPHPAPFWKPYEGLTRVLRIAVFLWGAAATALYFLAPMLAGTSGKGCDAGILATVRTAVLAAAALLLGWASRRPGFREAAWLVYPTLGLMVLKLAVEDFPHGRPATLFLALALCGVAFLLAPRLARGSTAASPGSSEPAR
jgi:hypothetical protein